MSQSPQIIRHEVVRHCQCRLNGRTSCGHRDVREVYWTVEGFDYIHFPTRKGAVAEAESLVRRFSSTQES